MQIIATNIGKPMPIFRNGKNIETGIYKTPVSEGIYLETLGVKGDHVMDTKVHGGTEKACYLYSADHYPFWKEKFSDMNWAWGMFGENLTVTGMDDSQIYIGDIFEIGDAIVQVSEPRRPCSTLGIKFGTQQIVKLFNDLLIPGTYVRVLQEGKIKKGNILTHIEKKSNISVAEIFSLFSLAGKDFNLAKKAMELESLSIHSKNAIKKYINSIK